MSPVVSVRIEVCATVHALCGVEIVGCINRVTESRLVGVETGFGSESNQVGAIVGRVGGEDDNVEGLRLDNDVLVWNRVARGELCSKGERAG